MSGIKIPEREVPVVKETDVVVVGGGLAGVAAAAAAARQGMKVTLIEKTIALGGLATMGHVCIYLPIDDGNGNKVYGGLAEDLLHVCIKYSYDNLPEVWRNKPDTAPKDSERYQTNFNIPAAVLALDEFAEEEGIDVVFDTVFSEPIMDGKTVKGIVVENKSGRTAYMAKMFIDASGDSDLLYRAGADTETLPTIVSHWFHELDFKLMKEGIEKGDMMLATPLRWLGLTPSGGAGDEKEDLTCDGTTSEGVNKYIRLSRGLALDFLKKHQSPDFCMISSDSGQRLQNTVPSIMHTSSGEKLTVSAPRGMRSIDSAEVNSTKAMVMLSRLVLELKSVSILVRNQPMTAPSSSEQTISTSGCTKMESMSNAPVFMALAAPKLTAKTTSPTAASRATIGSSRSTSGPLALY